MFLGHDIEYNFSLRIPFNKVFNKLKRQKLKDIVLYCTYYTTAKSVLKCFKISVVLSYTVVIFL